MPHTSSSTCWCPAPATPARPTISPGETRRLKSCRRSSTLTPRISRRPASSPSSSASATCSRSSASGFSAASASACSGGLPSMAVTIAGTVSSARGSAAMVTSPSRRTVTSSHSAITSSRMWETKTTPTSRSRRTRRMSSSVSVLAAPSAEVGSSRIRIRGSVSSALPISTSWRWARLSSSTGVRRSTSRPSSSITGLASAAMRARLTNGPRRGSRSVNRLASTSRSGKTLSSCETTATPWRPASAVEAKSHLLAVEAHGARVGLQRPGDDLDERRLAGAVLPQQGVHRAGADREVRAGQGHDPAVGLANAVRFEH